MNIEKRFLSEKIKELKINEEERTIELSWASETPYERNDGYEILLCDNKNCDLTRLNDAHPLLFNHNWDAHIGVIEKAWFDENKIGRAIVRFSKNQFADEKFKDVVDKILNKVSVGYAVEEVQFSKDGKSYFVTKWIPFEISLVTVPADNNVGTLKFMEILKEKENNIMKIKELNNQENQENLDKNKKEDEEIIIDNEKAIDDIDTIEEEDPKLNNEESDVNEEINEEEKAMDEVVDENKKNEVIDENKEKSYNKNKIEKEKILMEKNLKIKKLVETFEQYKSASVDFLIDETKTAEDFENFIKQEENKKTNIKGHRFNMKKDTVENYNINNAIRSLVTKENSIEKEIGQDYARQNGSYMGGLFIPFSLMERELTGANTTNLQATTLSNYIDPLYSNLVLDKAGIQTISGLVGNVAMPKGNGAGSVGFIDTDTTGVSFTNQAFTQVTVNKRTASTGFILARNAVLMPQFDVKALELKNKLMKLALFEEKTIIDELKAKLNSTAVAIGAAPTYQQILSLKSVIKNRDAILGKINWLMNPMMEAKLKSTGKPATIMNAVLENGTIDGDQALVTSQYTDQTGILVGDFSQVYKIEWSGVEILVDESSLSDRGAVRFSIFHDFGWNNTYDDSFLLAKETV